MTIRIVIGAVGSGKTAVEVLNILENKGQRKTYSNIVTTLPNQITINPEMIIEKKIVDYKKNKKTGEDEPISELSLNLDFWKNINEPINVVIDEAHSVLNSRRSMSKANIILTDWMALIRRILGSNDGGHGELVLITQLPNRLDTIARDMATQIKYIIGHYKKRCKECGLVWSETSEDPERVWNCYRCDSTQLLKFAHCMEIFKFANMKYFYRWEEEGKLEKSEWFYNHYYLGGIEKVFPKYSTVQWDNLFASFY